MADIVGFKFGNSTSLYDFNALANKLELDTTLTETGKAADAGAVGDALADKVDVVSGKGLSTNDYTTAEKTKLEGIATGATNVTVDSTPTENSTNAVSSGGVYTELSELKEDFESDILSIENRLITTALMTASATSSGWRLNESDGLCSSNADYKLCKYTVTAGSKVKVVSDDRFQFQSSASVPSSGTSNRVGDTTYGTGTYILTVPTGATYLITSTLVSGGTMAVYSATDKDIADNADLEKVEEYISFIGNGGNGEHEASTSDFTAGTFSTSTSEVNTVYPYRVTQNKNAPYAFAFTMKITADTGFRFIVYICDSEGVYEGENSGWTTSYTIAKDTYFRLMIARTTEDSSEIADVSEFVGAISFNFVASIIYRNIDVLPAVNASCYYGVNGNGTANLYKKFALLVTTDIHGCSDQMNSAVEYLNSIDCLDAGICLGDMAASNWTNAYSWYNEAIATADKPWYTVIGNHDGGNSTDASISASQSDIFSRWIAPNLESMGMPSLTTPYYSFTQDDVTFIVLDAYDVPDDLDSDDNFVVSRGTLAYSQAQIDWLISTLNSVPSGNTVVICTHYLSDPMTADAGDWTQSGVTFGTYPDYQGLIPAIVNAWANGSTLSASYEPVTTGLPTLSVSADFTSRGAGVFACYLTGHVHKDLMGHITAYTSQKVVNLASTSNDNYQNKNSDLPRAKGTKAEDCITVFVVDTSTDTIRLVRVGSNITTVMTERTMFLISYA